jgi:hypothetical protein
VCRIAARTDASIPSQPSPLTQRVSASLCSTVPCSEQLHVHCCIAIVATAVPGGLPPLRAEDAATAVSALLPCTRCACRAHHDRVALQVRRARIRSAYCDDNSIQSRRSLTSSPSLPLCVSFIFSDAAASGASSPAEIDEDNRPLNSYMVIPAAAAAAVIAEGISVSSGIVLIDVPATGLATAAAADDRSPSVDVSPTLPSPSTEQGESLNNEHANSIGSV